MKVRAKFKIVRAKFKIVRKIINVEDTTIIMEPVMTGSEENDKFFRFIPNGEIELKVLKKETGQFFEPGKSYYVDFLPAE